MNSEKYDKIYNNFSKEKYISYVKEYINNNNIDLNEFSNDIGMSRNYLDDIFNNKEEPYLVELLMINNELKKIEANKILKK